MNNFDKKYSGVAVSWEGYIIRVNALDDDSLSHFTHASSMLVKMVPDDKTPDDASLALTLSERVTENYKDEIMKLNIGDNIHFNATIVGLGDRTNVHHLHVFGIKKGDGSAHVNLHTHYNGRYRVRNGTLPGTA